MSHASKIKNTNLNFKTFILGSSTNDNSYCTFISYNLNILYNVEKRIQGTIKEHS